MLKQVLRLIAATGRVDTAELARRLDITPALMQSMLDLLARQGYLQRVITDTTAACTHCPLRKGCLSDGKARLWTLSEKGVQVLSKLNV
jgi:hypothetical protein